MIRNRAAVLMACAALTACDGSVTPPLVPRDLYTLTPPAVLENEVVRIEILNETLSLFDDGTAEREYRQRLDYVSPQGRDTTIESREDYTYHVDGSTITFAADCDDMALCAPPPHLWGERTGTGLELRTHLDPDVVLRYRRVYPPD